ncbi:MAG: hypothetical protein EOM59_00840 [Clostridia bacterium]|nr:hypothetical protein [Clostridia bacterium]
MDKKRAIILGAAGAIAAAGVAGAVLFSGDRVGDGSSRVNDEGLTNSELEQIEFYNEEKQRLLDSLMFYQGSATIQENYRIVSPTQGDTPVVGSVAMVSEDIFVYDERTEKCYLLARRISLLGDDVKAFDIPRIYKGTVTVKVCGILTEYYGNGILQAYDVADAVEGKKGYYLNFSANPVRIGCDVETIYTNPPVRNTYWVQVIGPQSVDMVATGVFTPEELPDVEVGLMPGLSNVFGEKSYNSSNTLVYEYTGGTVIPQGTFSYDYKKMSYDEISDFLGELRAEAQKDHQLEEAAQNLSDAWKEALSAEHEIKTLMDASESIGSYAEHFSGETAVDAATAKAEADMLAGGADFNGEINRTLKALEALESDGGSLRRLEDFSLEGGEGDQKKASDAMRSLLPVLGEYLSFYKEAAEGIQQKTKELRGALLGKAELEADAILLLEQIRTEADELSSRSSCLTQLSSDFYSVLLGYIQSEGLVESEFAALSRLCEIWENTLRDFLSGNVPLVDLENGLVIPSDYPADIVPLLKDASIAIYETDEDGTIMLTQKSNMSQEDVIEYYQNALAGLQDLSTFSMGGMWTLSGRKENFDVSVLVAANQLGGTEKTMVQIVLALEM